VRSLRRVLNKLLGQIVMLKLHFKVAADYVACTKNFVTAQFPYISVLLRHLRFEVAYALHAVDSFLSGSHFKLSDERGDEFSTSSMFCVRNCVPLMNLHVLKYVTTVK
jgi:hypothetical protein